MEDETLTYHMKSLTAKSSAWRHLEQTDMLGTDMKNCLTQYFYWWPSVASG